jgi:hypothetical protein
MSYSLSIKLTPDTISDPVVPGAVIKGTISIPLPKGAKSFRLLVGPKSIVQALQLENRGFTTSQNHDDKDALGIKSQLDDHGRGEPPNFSEPLTASFLLTTAGLAPGQYIVKARLVADEDSSETSVFINIPVSENRLTVTKESTTTAYSHSNLLSLIIKSSSKQLEFNNYKKYMDFLLCGEQGDLSSCVQKYFDGVGASGSNQRPGMGPLLSRRFLPFTDTDGYRLLKVATEAFVAVKSGVDPTKFRECLCDDETGSTGLTEAEFQKISVAINATINAPANAQAAQASFNDQYLEPVGKYRVLPYLAQISQKLRGLPHSEAIFNAGAESKLGAEAEQCTGLLRKKLTCPVMIELIWSYWHEQGMLVQSMFAIRDRFQNRRSGAAPDPLAAMEIGYLRPLNNVLWGYIQDEQHRLTLIRRAYEYDHHYGLSLQGKAVTPMQTADSRSKFLEAFHNLLYLCVVFFKEDDDTNRKADAFPVLNALKEVHFLLSEGAHNQFGDLPTTSRIEMLMEQWLLARPEMEKFLPSRDSVAYPEDWMGPVDAMKSMQGWSNTSVMYFHDLGVFGEQLLLSIRYNPWSRIIDRQDAANWARIWRSEIQGYLHAYRTVTGVDVSIEPTEARLRERRQDPSLLLVQRLQEQQRLGAVSRGGYRLPPSPTAGLRLPAAAGERRRGSGGE